MSLRERLKSSLDKYLKARQFNRAAEQRLNIQLSKLEQTSRSNYFMHDNAICKLRKEWQSTNFDHEEDRKEDSISKKRSKSTLTSKSKSVGDYYCRENRI